MESTTNTGIQQILVFGTLEFSEHTSVECHMELPLTNIVEAGHMLVLPNSTG